MISKASRLDPVDKRSAAVGQPQGRVLAIAKFGLFALCMLVLRSNLDGVSSGIGAGLATLVLLILLLAVRQWLPRSVSEVAAFAATLAILVPVALPRPARAELLKTAWPLLALPVLLHLVWGTARGVAAARGETSAKLKIERTLGEIVPARLAALAAAEISILRHAFLWKGQPEMEPGGTPFTSYRLLSPPLWAFLALVVIEIGVVDLLVRIWSPTAAWLIFVASDISLLYLIGLIGSLRRLPTVLYGDRVEVRVGILYDFDLALQDLSAVRGMAGGIDLKAPGTLKASLLAYPNVVIDLVRPIPSPKPFRRGGPITRVALALDEPDAFLRAVKFPT